MLRRSVGVFGRSAFSVFLARPSTLKEKSVARHKFADARMKAAAVLFNKLSESQKKQLADVAVIMNRKTRKPKGKPNAYAKFVKANYSKVKGANFAAKGRAIAKAWNAKH